MELSKAALAYLMACESVEEVRGFLRGLSHQAGAEVKAQPEEVAYRMRHRGLQAEILRALYTGAVSQADLEAELVVKGTAMTNSLRAMEVAGLIENQVRAGRARATVWVLTEKGREKAKIFVDNPKLKIIPSK